MNPPQVFVLLMSLAAVSVTLSSGADPVIAAPLTAKISIEVGSAMIPAYTVTDADVGDVLAYSVTPTADFDVVSATGLVTTKKLLVTAATGTYDLTVTDGTTPVTATIAYTVFTDTVGPAITGNKAATVAEDVSVGADVIASVDVAAKIGATDADTGIDDGFTYELSGTGATDFKMDLFTGVTITAVTLDYETTPSYSLTVTVKDSKRTAITDTLIITVTNVDEAPVCTPDTILKDMLDGATIGTQVVTLSCIDPESDTITYAIPTGNTNTDYSVSGTGVIEVANALVKATTATYTLSVTATANSLLDTVTVTVTVLADTAPVCSPDTIAKNMADGATVGTQVGTLSCIDTDAGDIIAYAIVSGNTNTDYSVSAIGVIEVAKLLAMGTTSTYTLSVTATSNFKKDTVTVTVTVIADKAPVCSPSTITKNMADGAIVGTEVTTLSCTDHESQTLTYTFLDGNKDDDFAMDSSTGKMTVDKVLNKGRTSSYVVKAAVVDTASLTATTTTTITVVDTSGAINIANHLYIVAGLILLMKYLFE